MTDAIRRTQIGETVDLTLAGAGAVGEAVLLPDNRVGVVPRAIVAATEGAYALMGIHEVLSASATLFDDGEAVYWDASANLAVKVAGADTAGDFLVGFAVGAKVNGDLSVDVMLRQGPAVATIAAPAGGGTVDAEARTAIGLLTAALVSAGIALPA